MSTALVTGATGQDGGYLCEQLRAEGTEVVAAVERPELASVPWLEGAHVRAVDLRDAAGLSRLVAETAPDEIYNLAGMSSVARSWQEPVLTAEVNALPVAVLLQAARDLQERTGKAVRFVQASSAEIFGSAPTSPQDESTPVAPLNPYGATKAFAHQLVGIYRSLGVGASSCILYNHESPRRPEQFVTRKITAAAARIARGEQDKLLLGTLESRRDWGWAPDYVAALVLAARHTEPLDFVIATGQTHSVGDFVEAAFRAAGVEDWEDVVELDPTFSRPAEATEQRGNPARAHEVLGWRQTVDFEEIVRRMVAADLDGTA
ncbi:GDP-mannose 4,6-dehydratase [Rhodococcus sp. X156]|uniref:GDP-mannose 4,6-dehydratase n=1 Tax=Rhodococcus sp. X156 TaxID=2499145 RepID=UPI000FD93837|nr:GDP-mannose 4,6-dehydratase [Rhodococcus sp. X156]